MSRTQLQSDAPGFASKVVYGDISDDDGTAVSRTEPTPVWTAVAAVDDIPVREGRVVHVGGKAIAVFNMGDRFMAVDNQCPHKGGPLSDGIITGGAVVCPLHAWRINLTTGEVERPCEAAPAIHTYATNVDAGVVHVALRSSPGQRVPEST